jgi:hypothetical protein
VPIAVTQKWAVGVKLREPGNFWGLPSPPEDWEQPEAAADAGLENPFARPRASSMVMTNAAAVVQAVPAAPHGGAPETDLDSRVAAGLQRQAEESMGELRARIEQIAAERERELCSRLSATAAEASGALDKQVRGKVEEALQRIDAMIEEKRVLARSSFAEQVRTASDAMRAETQARDAGVQTAQRLEAQHRDFAASLQAAQDDISARIEQMNDTRKYIESLLASLPQKIAEETQRQGARTWQVQRDQAAEQLASVLRAEAERDAENLQHTVDEASRRLREEMQVQSQRTAQDLEERLRGAIEQGLEKISAHAGELETRERASVIRAGKDVRERTAAAIDGALEIIRLKADEAIAETETQSVAQQTRLSRQVLEAENRLQDAQKRMAEAGETQLEVRLNEALNAFRTDAQRLAESALQRWQAALDGSLRAIPKSLRESLENSAAAQTPLVFSK